MKSVCVGGGGIGVNVQFSICYPHAYTKEEKNEFMTQWVTVSNLIHIHTDTSMALYTVVGLSTAVEPKQVM